MIEIIKNKIKKNKVLLQNFSYLSLLQLFVVLMPLVTYPYLIKVLGLNLYGKVVYAQVIISYFSIFINFGFTNSATRDVSINRDNSNKLDEIVSSILIIKFILWLVSLGILILIIFLIPDLSTDKWFYVFSFGICFNELLFPQWFFQGIEKMKYITIINLIPRSFFLILTFVFINTKSDYIYVPLLNGIGSLIAGCTGLYVVFVNEKIKFRFQTAKTLVLYVKESAPLFFSVFVISIKDKFNVIFVGIFLGMNGVAIYDFGIKIMTVLIQPIEIISNTVYPKIAKEKNMDFMKKITKYTFVLLFFLVAFFEVFLSYIVDFVGSSMREAIFPTRILLIIPLVYSISIPLSRNCITALGKYRILFFGMFLTVIFYLFLIGLGFAFKILNYVTSFVIISLAVSVFELLYRIVVVRKYKLL